MSLLRSVKTFQKLMILPYKLAPPIPLLIHNQFSKISTFPTLGIRAFELTTENIPRFYLSMGLNAAVLPIWIRIRASELTTENIPEAHGCPVCSRDIKFNYKDVLFLSQFMTPEGYMMNRRQTGVCKKQHRRIQKLIHISRRIGLLPRVVSKDGDPAPEPGQKSKSMLKRTRYTKF